MSKNNKNPHSSPCYYHRNFISWIVLFVAILSIVNVIEGKEQQQTQKQQHHVHDENCDHDHDQEETVDATTATTSENEKKVPASSAASSHHDSHDHAEHVHDETCNHDHSDHATAGGGGGGDSSTKVPIFSAKEEASKRKAARAAHSHEGHDHSHSHSHNHGKPKTKLTPLMETIRDNQEDAFATLLDDPTTNIGHTQQGWPTSAVMYSFATRKYEFAEQLIAKGANVRAKNNEGVNALLLALKTIQNNTPLQIKLVTMIVQSATNATAVEKGVEVSPELEQEVVNDLLGEQFRNDYTEFLKMVAATKEQHNNNNNEEGIMKDEL